MSERKRLYRSDWLGIVLFAVGSLGAVLMLLAMSAIGPIEEKGELGPYAALWKNTLGVFPSLFLNASIAFLGARFFLEIGRATLLRNVLGCAGLAFALAVICGAWKIDAGGYIGQRTGAVVTEHTHVAVGTLIGLISFFAVAWFAWFRAGAIAEAPGEASAPVVGVVEKSALKIAVRPAMQKTTAANEGVSLAESAALFPDEDEPVVVRQLTADEVARAHTPFASQEIPPSPYPEDVRRKGQIPVGARPLETPHASTTTEGSVPAPAVYRWTAPREERADDGARAHLVETPAAPERPVEERIEPQEAPELSVPEVRMPSAPSWEQPPAVFKPEIGDEEPVDAYGTPLTLVEKLREARRQGGLDAGDALPRAEAAAIEAPARDVVVPRELDADEPTVPFVVRPVEFEALEAPVSEETDLEELEETELEETDLFAQILGGNEDDDEADVDPTDTKVGARYESLVTPVRTPKSYEVQPSLFDAQPEAKPVLQEREVVLQPVVAPQVQERTTKEPAAATDSRTQLLGEIGCLFIERGRVAVSMLQRQYEMDFDAACKVLDELQEMGLIGPYLGGQRRDILLTREQWTERVSQATASH